MVGIKGWINSGGCVPWNVSIVVRKKKKKKEGWEFKSNTSQHAQGVNLGERAFAENSPLVSTINRSFYLLGPSLMPCLCCNNDDDSLSAMVVRNKGVEIKKSLRYSYNLPGIRDQRNVFSIHIILSVFLSHFTPQNSSHSVEFIISTPQGLYSLQKYRKCDTKIFPDLY